MGRASRRGHGHRPVTLGFLALLAAFTGLIPACAWKPVTHVHLADQALKDALNDGRITIYAVDYDTGRILRDDAGRPRVIGTYAADPDLLRAIRDYPEKFWAGTLGPDAFPDIATGQEVIHTPSGSSAGEDVNVNGPTGGSDAWLQYLWNACHAPGDSTEPNKAFVAGFLAHAAGDMYAHTLINHYTGGLFHPVSNAVQHVTLEGYLEERTPDIRHDGERDPAPYDTGPGLNVSPANHGIQDKFGRIYDLVAADGLGDGISDFLYRNTVNAGITPQLFSVLQGSGTAVSVPWLYSTLRVELQAERNAYRHDLSTFDTRYAQKVQEADALAWAAEHCAFSDPHCSATWDRVQEGVKRAEAVTIAAEKALYQATYGAADAYKAPWISDIDSGLRQWPQVSLTLATQIFFNSRGLAQWDEAQLTADHYKPTMLNMSGAPSFATNVYQIITDTFTIPFHRAIQTVRDDVLNATAQAIFQQDADAVKRYYLVPHLYLNEVFRSAANPLTLADANHMMGLNDPGWTNPGEKFDWHNVPAAYDTVTMIKLMLMRPDEVDRLIGDVHGSASLTRTAPTNPPNVMLGFMASLDGQNQWAEGAQMVMARDPRTYRALFMKVTPEDPIAARAVTPLPPFEIRPSVARLSDGRSQQFTVSSAGTWSVGSEASFVAGWSRLECLPGNPTDRARLYAADDVPAAGTITLTCRESAFPNRVATATVILRESLHLSTQLTSLSSGETFRFTSNQDVPMTWTAGTAKGVPIGQIDGDGTYTAPKQIVQPTNVIVRAVETATPGVKNSLRSAVAVIRLRPDPAPLQISPSGAELGAGAGQRFTVTPHVPVTWSVVSDGAEGQFGDASSLEMIQLKQDIEAFQGSVNDIQQQITRTRLAIPTIPPALNPAERKVQAASLINDSKGVLRQPKVPPPALFLPEALPLDALPILLASTRPSPPEQMLDDRKTTLLNAAKDKIVPKIERLEAIRSTFHAPQSITKSHSVTIRATATDGTGRTATAVISLVPGPIPEKTRDKPAPAPEK